MLFVWRLECSILSLIYSYYCYSENFLQARIFFEQLNFERVVESVSYKVDMIKVILTVTSTLLPGLIYWYSKSVALMLIFIFLPSGFYRKIPLFHAYFRNLYGIICYPLQTQQCNLLSLLEKLYMVCVICRTISITLLIWRRHSSGY